ncbi:dnaJ homolog subfamily C member 4 isoform X3 [Emys orbicularis]|uniref:dnaJ homolog subfamily C member 4 isoform X3 n=1 Tax=Emys orbicularis TaxID=82168 RepID=UPI0031FC4DA1
MTCWESSKTPPWKRSNKPSSPSQRRFSKPLIIFYALLWTLSSLFTSFLKCSAKTGHGTPAEASPVLHPDSDPNNPDLHSQFIQLNQAYRVLSKEGSRRLYDSQRAWHAAWPTTGSSPKHSPFDFTDLGPRPSTSSRGPDENMRYWEQFRTHRAKTFSGTQAKQRQHWNWQFFGYCLLLMLASMAAHYVAYRKLEEVHNSFMDKKDMLMTSIYNESKERARANGFQKQQELLRQKHAKFIQHYRIRPSGDSAQK